MAETVASSLLRLVFDKLGTKVMEEFAQLMGVDKELKKLESTLSTIQDVLEDAEARQVKERAINGWLRKLKDVAFDIDDVLDEVHAKALKKSQKDKSSMKEKVHKLSSIPSTLLFKSKIANKIKEIRERLDDISAERYKFHLQGGVITVHKPESGVREESSSFVIESEIYGRQEDKEKIVDYLTNMSTEADLGVIVIVGLGGLGKTTVAQLVYNDERVCSQFEKKIWVSVSDDFDISRLSRSIVESLTKSKCDLPSADLIHSSLREELGGKRFFLVLDDVWNENCEKWERLRALLTVGSKGSKVLVTTRNKRIASLMGTVEPHSLKGLSEDDCWLLFERRAFGSDSSERDTNLVRIGKEIVKKCGGIPLAAKALGSLMRFKRRESEWSDIRDNDLWRLSDQEKEILPALQLSYNHLPSRLKQCFAYCAIFPKNQVVGMETLVQLWIAEGFIQSSDRTTDLKNEGLGYVDDLISRSLFEKDGDYGIRMHDLVHDLAQSVAGEECSIISTNSRRQIAQNTRYASFLYGYEQISAILTQLHVAKKLRTFYFVESILNQERVPQNVMTFDFVESVSKEVLQVVFTSMMLLRVLHLSWYPMKELPVSVKNLSHLRYLDLSLTRLVTLPPCIGLLQNLQTLELYRCTRLEALPDSIGDLFNLSVLDLAWCTSLEALPDSIGDLFNLSVLDLTRCSSLHFLPSSLGHLRSLQGLNLSGSGIDKLPESLSCLSNLQSLGLGYCYSLRELPENIENMTSLTNLDITRCDQLTFMPSGIGKLNHLRTVPIFVLGGKSNCNLGELSSLNLEGELHIKNLENMKNVKEAKEANLIQKQGLKTLRLSWNLDAYKKPGETNSENIYENEKTVQEFFEALAVQDWVVDTELVEDVLESIQPHKTLSILKIEGYLGRVFPRWLMELGVPDLVELTLEGCMRCEILPQFRQLHSLKVLELNTLLLVQCLPALGQLPSLTVLKLCLLPAIKCLGSEFYGGDGAFPVLEELELVCMPELVEWSRTAEVEFLPRLSNLTLGYCPKLKALPSDFQSVKKLSLCADDELLVSSLQSGAFPNLEDLDIYNCENNELSSLHPVLAQRIKAVKRLRRTTEGMRVLQCNTVSGHRATYTDPEPGSTIVDGDLRDLGEDFFVNLKALFDQIIGVPER